MDWDLKMPPWDLSELEPNAEHSIGSVVGPSGGGRQAAGLDCSVDLKLGGLGDFGTAAAAAAAEKWKDQQRVPVPSSSSSAAAGPSKRARAPSNASQNVSCAVDGCKADLSNCREYHRRHKVCEVHSKTPIVLVGGQEQRFCQQCSRFHMLVEFDEVKRSCRKRLDGHNRRRRKPQPESINTGSLFPSHQGARFSSYPQIFPPAAPEPAWASIVKTEDEPLYAHHQPLHFLDRHHHFPSSNPRNSYKEGKNFPFLQDTDTTLSGRTSLEPAICQPLLKTISSVETTSTKMMFSDGLTQVLDSDCALSLLSSPPQTSGINLGQIVPSDDRIPVGQPLLSSLQYGGLGLGRYSRSQASNNVSTTGFSCSGMEDEHVGTVLVSDASDADLNCHGLFSVGGEGSSDGATQAMPFSWQ